MVVLDANFSSETIDCILQVCHSLQIPVFFEPTDPRKARKAAKSAFASAIHFASPNIHELRTMASQVLPSEKELPTEASEDDLEALLKECTSLGTVLMQKMPFATLVITLGKHGAFLMEAKSGATCHLPSQVGGQDDIVSASGAGDCLAAAFISGLLQGQSPQNALRLGLKAAKLSLAAIETVPQTLSKLKSNES